MNKKYERKKCLGKEKCIVEYKTSQVSQKNCQMSEHPMSKASQVWANCDQLIWSIKEWTNMVQIKTKLAIVISRLVFP